MEAVDNCSWVGADKVLVEQTSGRSESKFLIVDLRLNCVVQKVGRGLCDKHPSGALGVVNNILFAIGNYKYETKSDDDCQEEYDLNHDGVSYYDLSCSEPEDTKWKPLDPKMLDPIRDFPSVISLGTKIYVFTGTSNGVFCVGEYYDTADKAAGWLPILLPSGVPFDLAGDFISDPSNERIICIFYRSMSLYAYYPNKQNPDEEWKCLYGNGVYLLATVHAPSTVANGILVHVSNDELIAYDINTNDRLVVSWSSKKPFGRKLLRRCLFIDFIHLGEDILCLPTISHNASRTPPVTEFYRFQVRRGVNPGEVVFTPLSVHHIPLNSHGYVSQFLPI